MARQRQTTATNLRLVLDTSDEALVRVGGACKADPRLIDLVRHLARQAARDFIQQETVPNTKDRLSE